MRIALITIGGDAEDVAAQGQVLLGRRTALRQLEFARAAGCEAAIGLGDGTGAMAIELRHVAEAGGMKFRTMTNTHNLLGAVGTGDELLVLAPGLLPESAEVLELVQGRHSVVLLPADEGVAAGFERIDANHAWAGVLLMPGRLVERLAQLPRECDAAPSLLRIALQAGIDLRLLAPATLTAGSWIMAHPSLASAVEAAMLDRRMSAASGGGPSRSFARGVLRRFAPSMLRRKAASAALNAVTGIIGIGACVGAAYGHPALALVAVALCALLAEIAIGFERLGHSPLTAIAKPDRFSELARWFVDAVLLVCVALAIPADWHRQAFPPLILLLALHVRPDNQRRGAGAVLGDRAVLAIVLACAALVGYAEYAAMLLAVLTLGVIVLAPRLRRG